MILPVRCKDFSVKFTTKNIKMTFTPRALNLFLLRHIPIARIAGIRVKEHDNDKTLLQLTHRWLNQNPFRSIYFGVLVMAGELATGIPLYRAVAESGKNISMLVLRNESVFHKKATGKISVVFENDGLIAEKLRQAEETGEAVLFWLESKAFNASGQCVAEFRYEWSVKRR